MSGPGRPAGSQLVSRALADTAKVGPFFALAIGAECRGWPPATQEYRTGLRDVLAAAGQRLGSNQARVTASIVHLDYAARLWSPVLGCALLHGIVPDLAGLRLSIASPIRLGVRAPSGWQATEPALLAALSYHAVVEQQLEPLGDALPVKLAPGLLLGNAASALTGALGVLARVRPDLRSSASALASALLDTGKLRGTGRLTAGGTEFVRNSCCLYYRVPGGGLCADCCLPARSR